MGAVAVEGVSGLRTLARAKEVIAGLPLRQAQAFRLCCEFYRLNDQLPTRDWLAQAMGVKSSHAAQEFMEALERKGVMERNALGKMRFARVEGMSLADFMQAGMPVPQSARTQQRISRAMEAVACL